MTRSSCSSANSLSSSPIPLIGLYIAGATSVCFILMLCDIISSFRRKTRYIPCKLFSLNSATLTLLAIASKLPVDLTTYMPSAGDQLSKLAGTTVACTSICFLILSLASNKENESISNMIALTLFVVTIAVNICIQIYTGVIFLFIAEHIMILCCMLILLPVLWFYIYLMNNDKIVLKETMKNTLKKGEESSLLHQAKLWYMSSCISNPQYIYLGANFGPGVVMICFLCLTVLSQAAFRLLVHKLDICMGVSDYGWSIPIILLTQIITVVVGSLAAAFRWIITISDPPLRFRAGQLNLDFDLHFEVEIFSFKSLLYNREQRKVSILLSLFLLLTGVIVVATFSLFFFVLVAPFFVILPIFIITLRIFHIYPLASSVALEKWNTEMTTVFTHTKRFPKWIMRTCVEGMNKWTDLSNKSPPNYLVQLLSKPRARPPQTLLNKLQQIGSNKEDYKLSCLSMVILVKIVALSVPFALAEPIMQALDEAFEVVYYIDKKINVGNSQDRTKRRLAKVLLAHKNAHLSKKDSSAHSDEPVMSEALSSIENECKAFPNGVAKEEMTIIMDFVRGQEYASIEELYEDLEQLFVDMLLFFLPQLPIVTLMDLNESPIEVLEERARSVLKILCKLKLLEDKVQWLFPEGCHTTRLMDPNEEEECEDDQARNTENQNLMLVDQDGRGSTIQVPNVATPDDIEMGSTA